MLRPAGCVEDRPAELPKDTAMRGCRQGFVAETTVDGDCASGGTGTYGEMGNKEGE